MRNLIRNNRKMWYATYSDSVKTVDENGDYTGDDTAEYSDPVEFHANLSATRGTQGFTGTGASPDYFGADVDYALIISTAQMDLPINENTLIWTEQPVYINPIPSPTDGGDDDNPSDSESDEDTQMEDEQTDVVYGATGDVDPPQPNPSGVVDPNSAQYFVTAVARGLYHMKYAIKKMAGR